MAVRPLALAAVAQARTDTTLSALYGVAVRETEVDGVRRGCPVRR